jgi:ABC-type uncharacterized transport system ATPase subunit
MSTATAGSVSPTGAGSSEPVLRTSELCVRFGGVRAVSDVSISVPRGQVRGLIGPNGAGKTTFFDMITGVRAPTSGHVYLDGVDITDKPSVWRSRHGIRRTADPPPYHVTARRSREKARTEPKTMVDSVTIMALA